MYKRLLYYHNNYDNNYGLRDGILQNWLNPKNGAPQDTCCIALSGTLHGVTSQNRLDAPQHPLFKPLKGILAGASFFWLADSSQLAFYCLLSVILTPGKAEGLKVTSFLETPREKSRRVIVIPLTFAFKLTGR